jgi:hypothetical protein
MPFRFARNSKRKPNRILAAFNDIFKKFTDTAPSKYRDSAGGGF